RARAASDDRSCAGFRLPGWRSIHALLRPAAEKRQGTKSQSVADRGCRGRYGDFVASLALLRLERWGRCDRVTLMDGGTRRCGRVDRTLDDRIDGVTAGRSGGPMRASELPAASQQE